MLSSHVVAFFYAVLISKVTFTILQSSNQQTFVTMTLGNYVSVAIKGPCLFFLFLKAQFQFMLYSVTCYTNSNTTVCYYHKPYNH